MITLKIYFKMYNSQILYFSNISFHERKILREFYLRLLKQKGQYKSKTKISLFFNKLIIFQRL